MGRFPTDELHQKLQILKVEDIMNQEILTFVHGYFANKLPPAFDNYYRQFSTLSDRITCNSSTKIKLEYHDTDIAAKSLKISGAKKWNELKNDLKSITRPKNSGKNTKPNASHISFHLLLLLPLLIIHVLPLHLLHVKRLLLLPHKRYVYEYVGECEKYKNVYESVGE